MYILKEGNKRKENSNDSGTPGTPHQKIRSSTRRFSRFIGDFALYIGRHPTQNLFSCHTTRHVAIDGSLCFCRFVAKGNFDRVFRFGCALWVKDKFCNIWALFRQFRSLYPSVERESRPRALREWLQTLFLKSRKKARMSSPYKEETTDQNYD